MSCEAKRFRRIEGHRSYHRERLDLISVIALKSRRDRLTQGLLTPDLNLGIFPPRHFYDKVDDSLVAFVGVKGYIMPERDGVPSLLEPDPPVLSMSDDKPPNFIHRLLTRVFRAPTVLKERSEKKFPSFSLLAIEAALAKPASSVELTKAEIMVS
jgi:hypothetical protein